MIRRNILSELKINIDNMTNSQKKVADYILKNPIQAAFFTIDQLANEVDTSTATIIRLAQSFDYSGYAELQKNIQDNLQEIMSPSLKLEENFKKSPLKSNILTEIVEVQMDNVKNTLENIDDNLISDIEIILSHANKIHVIGSRSCFGVSHYLYYNLNRIFGNCFLISVEGGELAEKIHRIDKDDVLIAISFERYIKDVVITANYAKKKQAKVLSITDRYISPLMKYSDLSIRAETKSPDFHHSLTSTLLIAEVIISIAAIKNPKSAKKILQETENILKDLDVHLSVFK